MQGILKNGIVAVKKLKLSEMVDVHETKFIQEVDSLMKVKHKNIVRFLGYCSDTQGKMLKHKGKNTMVEERQRFLCFEFLPEGSLDKHISGMFLTILLIYIGKSNKKPLLHLQ